MNAVVKHPKHPVPVALNQRGAMHVVVVLAILVIGVLAYAGYYVATHNDKKPETQQTQTATPGTFQSNNDLEQAATSLEGDESDASLDPAQLDEDLHTLL